MRHNFVSHRLTMIRFSLFHWLYIQNGLNLFSRWQHSKKMLTKKEIIATSLFVSNIFYYLCTIRVITLKHNNEELRNTNGCYLVTQFSSNPTNRFILSKLSFLAKVTEKNRFLTKKIVCGFRLFVFPKKILTFNG